MHKFFHVMGHVGLITISVGAAAGWLAPPPFNIAIVAGAATAQGIISLVANRKKQ